MPEEQRHGVNAVDIAGDEHLLVETSGGSLVHLARVASAGETARASLEDFHFSDEYTLRGPGYDSYDVRALRESRWSPTTLCGREWLLMAGGEGGMIHEWGVVALAPSCRACLRCIETRLAGLPSDARLEVFARRTADIVIERGTAEVWDVPGDQLAELRRRVRAALRRVGFRSNSYVQGALLIFTSDDAYQAMPAATRERRDREVAEAMGRVLESGDVPSIRDRPSRLHWSDRQFHDRPET